MKIKLISPRMTLRPMDTELKRRMAPSQALLILAALTPEDCAVVIEDENTGSLHLQDRPDLVGITVTVDTASRAYEIARSYRRKGTLVVLGGIHASANPQEAAEHADALCIGEGEMVWPELLDDARAGRLKKVYANPGPVDPAIIPAPKWSAIRRSDYLYTNTVIASRGCPFACEFCYNSCNYVHRGHRPRPVSRVVEEIQALGTGHVLFVDDNLIGSPAWTAELLDALGSMNLVWHAAVSTNLVQHPRLIERMAETGCRSLFIGFETLNEESLRSAGKAQNKQETYGELVRELHRVGIMVHASLVFGFDHDTPAVFRNSLDWLVKNKVETMTAHILTPYPGTALFQRLSREGRIFDGDGSHYNTSKVVFEPGRMSRGELQEGYLGIYREFYSMKSIIERLPRDAKRRNSYLLFNLLYRKFGAVTQRFTGAAGMAGIGRFLRRLSYGIE